MYKVLVAGSLATAFLLGSSALAAQSTVSLNVRSGPSTSYGVVDVLFPGEYVDVTECRTNGWCYVVHDGPDGWVSRNYLTGLGEPGPAPAPRPEPNVNIRLGVPFNFSFGRGSGFSIGSPPRGGNQDLVCLARFYSAGQVEGGADANVQSARVLPRWQAERIDGPNDRYGIFDYGTNAQTRDTCEYLDRLN